MSTATCIARRPSTSGLDLPALVRAVRSDLDELTELLAVLVLDTDTELEATATLYAVGGLLHRLAGRIEREGPG
jgi:hypothetical protein